MKYLLFTILFLNFFSAQSKVDFTPVIKNNHNYFEGIKNKKQEVKIKFDSVYTANQEEYLVEGIADIGKEVSKVSGVISFNKKETKKFKDPGMYNFDVVLNIENSSGLTTLFNGSLNIKMMSKIFNVVVFEGVYQDGNGSYPMNFDNSNAIMNFLETLKK